MPARNGCTTMPERTALVESGRARGSGVAHTNHWTKRALKYAIGSPMQVGINTVSTFIIHIPTVTFPTNYIPMTSNECRARNGYTIPPVGVGAVESRRAYDGGVALAGQLTEPVLRHTIGSLMHPISVVAQANAATSMHMSFIYLSPAFPPLPPRYIFMALVANIHVSSPLCS